MSETELRILTVALNQKNDCWVLCRKTELIFLIWGIWTHNYKSRKSEMGLRILTVAWKQKESLLSIVSENWTHFFKSRKSEKPYWAKKNRKNCHTACSKQVWTLLGSILGIFGILNFFWFFRKLSMNPWNNEQKNFCKKIATRHVWTLGNDFRHFWNFERFLIFFINYF